MEMSNRRAGRRERGFLSIEAMIAVVMLISVMALGMQFVGDDAQLKLNRDAANDLAIVADATGKWVKDNNSSIVAAATPSVTYPATVLASYLPAGWIFTNAFGQGYSIRVYQPAANQLQVMVVTTGGEVIPGVDQRKIAQQVKGGGYIPSSTPANARGGYGQWNTPLASFGGSPGAGRLAVNLAYRDDGKVRGQPLWVMLPERPSVVRLRRNHQSRSERRLGHSRALPTCPHMQGRT